MPTPPIESRSREEAGFVIVEIRRREPLRHNDILPAGPRPSGRMSIGVTADHLAIDKGVGRRDASGSGCLSARSIGASMNRIRISFTLGALALYGIFAGASPASADTYNSRCTLTANGADTIKTCVFWNLSGAYGYSGYFTSCSGSPKIVHLRLTFAGPFSPTYDYVNSQVDTHGNDVPIAPCAKFEHNSFLYNNPSGNQAWDASASNTLCGSCAIGFAPTSGSYVF